MFDIPNISLKTLICKESKHNESPCIALCIDPNCKEKNKLLCLECIFNQHQQHKIIKLTEIEDKINQKLLTLSGKEKEDIITKNIKTEKEKINDEFRRLKKEMDQLFKTKSRDFIYSLEMKINEQKAIENNGDIQFLFEGNFPPINEDDYFKLGNNLIKYYQSFENGTKEIKIVPSVEATQKFLEEFDKNLKTYFDKEYNKLCQFFQKSFLNSAFLPDENLINFEWDTKVFREFGFFYQISENSKKITKKLNDGTITVALSKNQLFTNENYLIELEVDKKGGEIDVGFGLESIGNCYFGKVPNAYCVTNAGIYESGKRTVTNFDFKNQCKLSFEIYFTKPTKECIIKMDGETVHKFQFMANTKDIYYIFTAIRNVGNSVKVIKFKRIEEGENKTE